jgi:hypothetical protein
MNRSNRRYAIAARLLTLLCLTGIASCKNDSGTAATTPGPPMKGVPGHPDAQGSDGAMYRAIDKAMAKKQQQQQQPQGSQ